jgi:hypothetical protein
MEEVMARARRLAAKQPFEPAEVLRWLREGSDEERIIALAMMQERLELRNFDAALKAMEDSHSTFEQHNAIWLIAEMIDDLDQAQRRRLATAVRAQQGLRFGPGTSRWQLSEDILQRLDGRSDAE